MSSLTRECSFLSSPSFANVTSNYIVSLWGQPGSAAIRGISSCKRARSSAKGERSWPRSREVPEIEEILEGSLAVEIGAFGPNLVSAAAGKIL